MSWGMAIRHDSVHGGRLYMNGKKNKELVIYAVTCLVLLVVIILLAAGYIRGRKDNADVTAKSKTSAETGKKLFDNEPVPEEIVTINTQIIEDGLKEMGVLITQEYYFTQVEEYSSSKKLWLLDSKAYLAYSYDGVVNAGIDCNDVDITKDDENKKITVRIPAAKIIDVSIDFDSFKTLEEKNGLWNKLDMSDYNSSLVAYENAAKDKAIEKGIIDKADEGAKKMIESFVNSLVDSEEYTIEYVKK